MKLEPFCSFRGTKCDRNSKKGKTFWVLSGNTKIAFLVSILLHSNIVMFPFWDLFKKKNKPKKKIPEKSSFFLKVSYVWLQEAVFYLGRSWGAEQSVSLTGLLQPVLFWKGFSRVLRHGVSLLLQSQRAEGRKTEHSQSRMSQKRTLVSVTIY